MAFNTQEQAIIKYGLANGKTRQETEKAIANYRQGTPTGEGSLGLFDQEQKTPTGIFTPAKEALSGLQTLYGGGEQGIASKLQRNIKDGASDIEQGNVLKGVVKAGFRTAGDVAQTVYSPIGALVQSTGLGKVFEKIGEWSQKGKYNPINMITDLESVQKFVAERPNLEEDFNRALTLAMASLDKGKIDPKTVVSRTIKQVTDAATATASKTSALKESVQTGIETAVNKGKQVIADTKTALSRSNVPENFQTSVERLSKTKTNTKTGIQKTPLDKYTEYFKQEQKFKIDKKQDTAVSKVGEDMGNQFERVIKSRRTAGETMGSEIKKFGSTKIDISDSFPKLEVKLQDSGVTYSKGKVRLSDTSKITTQDANLLNNYITELNKLGTNPTAAQLDAFLSRTPENLRIYKAKNNIMSTTNGERMIKSNLAEIRNSLIKEPSLSTYAKARNTYSRLSDFIDEGISYLGKKTQSGDYAKDASIAKSSVQSILNNGKKDWMLKLEDLTGYPAIDNTVLALQAMKDAGNFMGNSLLELLTPGQTIPTSKFGVIEKVIQVGFEKGKKAFTGSPSEQTIRIIEEIMRKP